MRSAILKNFNPKASSINPKTTLTEFNHPPDFGNLFIHDGKNANNVKGKAKAKPKPLIPIVSWVAPPSAVKELPKSVPKIGPVHEKDTIASVSAIKKTPMKPPILLALLSIAALQDCGKVNS